MRSRMLSALASVALVAGAVDAQEPPGTVSSLTALDYAQIEMLYGRNNMALDSGADGGSRFARTFTADGELRSPRGRTVGHAALARLAADTERGLRHWTSNLMIEPSADGAIGWGYIRELDVEGVHYPLSFAVRQIPASVHEGREGGGQRCGSLG